MSSFDKTVKRACKPKPVPPKAKYVDPLIAATYSEDGTVHDVCKALSPRFREPNAIVVFKALILLHTMIRNGATDNLLSYLSGSDVLHLHNVYSGQWEGYNAPQNLQRYAAYLDARIRAYKDLKHDPVRVQSEVNRDMRLENSIEEDRERNPRSSAPQRSKTIAGRKLRVMTVEKGLLRETKSVLRVIAALLDCKFYLDSLEDELNITALRMLVKDLLILFQAVNEGVINVLEHYFEMSHVDAEQALSVYRNFCKQTERVVDYLTVAKKLSNLLNVPIPNLKHAPVSLVGALEEYLKDPNFEQNRIEYRDNKALADKSEREPSKATKSSSTPSAPTKASTSTPSSAPPLPSTSKADTSKALVDFFSSIEEEQPTIFNPQTGSPTNTYFQNQAGYNPFTQQPNLPVNAFSSQPFGVLPQGTGFVQPQHTAFPGAQGGFNAFGQPQQGPQQPQPFGSFLQPPGAGALQPQATGFNPFRQSVLLPQATGLSPFAPGAPGAPSLLPFQVPGSSSFVPPSLSQPPQPTGLVQSQSNNFPTPRNVSTPFGNSLNGLASGLDQNVPTRPASTPITSFGNQANPVVSHQTGSKNPFGIPQASAPPPMPKAPTIQELRTGAFAAQSATQQQNAPASSQPQFSSTGVDISSIASSFVLNNKPWSLDSSKSDISNNTPTSTTAPSSVLSSSMTGFSTFSSQPTGTSNTSNATSNIPSISLPFSSSPTGLTSTTPNGATGIPTFSSPSLQPQPTGLAGLKRFQPTSSFGTALLESLPSIPEPTTPPTSATPNGPSSSNSGAFGSTGAVFNPTGAGALNGQPTGLSAFGGLGGANGGLSAFGTGLGVGLRPQATGLAGAANPFRASTLGPLPGGSPYPFGASAGQPQSLGFNATGAPSFGANLFQGGLGGPGAGAPGVSPNQQHQQQNGVASLI